MSLYSAYRDWVDSVMRESAIRAPATILLPASLPALAIMVLGIQQTVAFVLAALWGVTVIVWGTWRYLRILIAETHQRKSR